MSRTRQIHRETAVSTGKSAASRLCAGAAFLATVVAAWAPPAVTTAAPAKERQLRTVLEFDSRLQDEQDKPVSGIFRMTFALQKGKRAVWKESHWVAVDNGRYALLLGKAKALPPKLDPAELIIEVSIVGAGVILREPLAGRDVSLSQVDVGVPSTGKRIVPYAEKAGLAYDAEHAAVADRVGPYTGAVLQETLDRLEKRKAKVKVSRRFQNLQMAGGVGGTPFEQICPPGMVAVGLRGGSGIYIDNVQIICAPLE